MPRTDKGYRGLGMEGPIATWYAKNTGRDRTRFRQTADAIAGRAVAGSRILEVAPGPGFTAIELARRGFRVATLDISKSFVRIARDNARSAGASLDIRHGNVSAMPFADGSFDAIVCTAAFKNFSDPIGALDECHRVLAPGGWTSIYDLRKEASPDEIADEVRRMNLSRLNTWVTHWTFRTVLLKRAYTRDSLDELVARSRFGAGEIHTDGIGFELRLVKPRAA